MATTQVGVGPAAAAGTVTLGGELTVNRMGYGAMRLTGEGIWGPPRDRTEAKKVLHRAIELGVNFIDTAWSYGPGVSEALLAEALYPYPDGLAIATKGGMDRSGPGEWRPNGRPEKLRRDLEESLRRLKLDRIELWQLHRVDPEVPADEQFDALREFRREGLVRHVGLSEVGVGQIGAAQRVVPIVSVQNKYNVVFREWEPVLEYCEREGIAFIPWSPLRAGGVPRESVVERVARRRGVSAYAVALAWLLARSPVMLPIPGTSSTVHLEENVAAAQMRLSEEDLDLLDSSVRSG